MVKKVKVSVFQKPKKGNYYCGDSYYFTESDSGFLCAIADGLGSGEYAKESSQIVIDIIKNNVNSTVEQLIKMCNEQLFKKRGVVLGILKLNFHSQMYSYSSIGNIGVLTVVKGQKKKRSIPNGGYLAGYPKKFKVVHDKLEPETNFIMFSDGVSDKDLSQRYFLNKDVDSVIKAFEYMSEQVRDDDTTLIALRYDK
ncbi:protein phosphatase 2C domain-containing protein [Virgibacillus sp. C22-A2]|uniref:Protein phosphatase 2C domain-containing protein n=1 Tax=Virgibacillus tibetensis TaxID=3042313 RepID=A0ABU6KHB5_9BACI|nr:protein phosphatase 2C domain-containing protein [Virgibacillus sp. C22-A2]